MNHFVVTIFLHVLTQSYQPRLDLPGTLTVYFLRNERWLQSSNIIHASANRRFCLEVKILSGWMSQILHISGNLSPKFLSGSGTRISGLLEQIKVVEIGSRTFFRTSEISGLSEPGLTNHHCTWKSTKSIEISFYFLFHSVFTFKIL